jgi:fatty-acyl-CoA synthase
VIVIGDGGEAGSQPYEAFLAGGEMAPVETPREAQLHRAGVSGAEAPGDDDPLLLMYTSGTTGRPKGAVLTHRQMFWASATVVYTMDIRHSDVMLLPTPMYHIGGMCFVTILVHQGAAGVALPAWDPGEALRLVQAERVTHFMGVPTMLAGLLGHPAFAAADLGSLRWVLASAAPVPPDLIRAFAARGVVMQQSYGLTETAGPATVLSAELALEKAGSAGLPYFHTQVRVVDPDGRDAPPGEPGEIWIRGPHVITGYWQNPAATAAAFADGWFRSGDVGYRDADGCLYVVDRKQDMIISGGENVYPAEVENVLFAHPAVKELAVIGVPDAVWGEAVCAVVVPWDPAAPPSLEDLRRFCDGRLARYKLPRRLVVRGDALPRNPTGKLLKSRLREALQAADLRSAESE